MESFTTAACTLHLWRPRQNITFILNYLTQYSALQKYNINMHSNEYLFTSWRSSLIIFFWDESSADKRMILSRVYCFWFDKSSLPLLVSNGLFCIQPSTSHYLISKSQIEKTYLWQKCRVGVYSAFPWSRKN